eukprot:361207-Chlamydomonas_euryale.AAC.1
MDVYRTFVLPIFLYCCETWTWTEVQMGRLEVTHPTVSAVKLTDRHRLETIPRLVAEDGQVEQLKLRPYHRNMKDFSGMYSSAIRRCHEEGYGGGTTFRDLLKMPDHTKLIPWPEIRAAAA